MANSTRRRRAVRGAAPAQNGQALRSHITEDRFSFERKHAAIADEARLDGIYVIRTSVPAEILGDAATVAAYKGLSRVERAFRCLKTVDLEIRPIHQWLGYRPRTRTFRLNDRMDERTGRVPVRFLVPPSQETTRLSVT